MKQRLFLTFKKQHADQPILSSITSRTGCVFSIFGATVDEETQFFAIELSGERDEIEAAIRFLETEGVDVERSD